jgi:uncharacterized membrane protein YccC
LRRASFFQRTVSASSTFVSHARARVRFDLGGWSLRRGLIAALACCVPLLAAEWTGQASLSFAALIGFWVSLVDPGWPPRARLLAIGGYVVATAIGCFVAALLGPFVWASGAFALIWCTAAILTRVWGNTSGSAGNLSALAVIIALGDSHSSSLESAVMIAAATLGGGLWGLVLALSIGRRRPDAALRGALAAVFRTEAAFVRDLLREASADATAHQTPHQHRGAVRDAIENARRMLVAARREALGDGALLRRLSLMLGDAEQVLRALLALRETLEGETLGARARSVLSSLATRLDDLSAALAAGNAAAPLSNGHMQIEAPPEIALNLHHAMAWTEAARGHLAGPADSALPGQAIIEDEPIGWLAQLRNNLTFDSLSMRHALRFGLTAAGLTMLTKALALPMGYWITLTATIILQAYPSATWQRAIERVGGTLAGGLIATASAYLLHGPAAILVVIVPLSLLAMASRAASYALYMVCITPMFILVTELFSNGGVLSPELAGVRMIDNVIGAAAGMLSTFLLWPSWESRYLRRRLADDLRCHGTFLLTALEAWQGTATPQQADVARRLAGLAGNNAEASVRRAFDEPRRRPADELAAAMQITAAARRLSGIAAAIVQGARPAGGERDLTETRKDLEAQLNEVVDAVALGRHPTAIALAPADAHDASPIELLLSRAQRQLTVAREAALHLAVDRTGRA